jgi:hypothetical protein
MTILLEDKQIRCVNKSKIYQRESNVDLIKVIIPRVINGTSTENADVLLCYFTPDNKTGCLYLERGQTPYNKDNNQYFLNITSCLTDTSGTLRLWIKLYDTSIEMNLETNALDVDITPREDFLDRYHNEKKNYFDQWLIKMHQIKNEAAMSVKEATEQVNIIRSMVSQIQGGAKSDE